MMQMRVDVRNRLGYPQGEWSHRGIYACACGHKTGLVAGLAPSRSRAVPGPRAVPGLRTGGGEVERGDERGCASPGASRTRRRAQATHTLTRVPGADPAHATRRIPGLESKGTPASSLSTKLGPSTKRASCSAGHFEADSRSASRVILRVKPYSSHAEPAKNAMPSTFAIGEKPSPMKGNASGESDPVAPAMPA